MRPIKLEKSIWVNHPYIGEPVEISDNFKWFSIDSLGRLVAWEEKPNWHMTLGEWESNSFHLEITHDMLDSPTEKTVHDSLRPLSDIQCEEPEGTLPRYIPCSVIGAALFVLGVVMGKVFS